MLVGVKGLRTLGRISAGSRQLVVASVAGFAVGDSIIVELGGEASGGLPGSPGVGGVWPVLAYVDEAAMVADVSQPSGTYAYCQDTGLVHQWDAPGVGRIWFHDPAEFYWRSAVPLALTAKVVAISGATFILSAAAAVGSAGANVFFDNAPVFNGASRAAADNTALIWPPGEFACGSILEVANRAGMRIAGAGQKSTKLFSPKGVISMGLAVTSAPHTEVCNLTLAGNAYLTSGWGLDLRYSKKADERPQWNYALDMVRSDHCDAHDLAFAYPWLAAGAHYCYHCTFRRLSVSTDGLQRYVSWMITWVNSTNCWSYDCEVNSTYITKAFECFASNNCGHIRPRTINGVFALNSTGHCIIGSPVARFTARSVLSQLSIPFPGTPIVDVTTNIDQNPGQSGNAVLNMRFVQQGYLTPNNDVMIGVNVSDKSRDTLICGGSYAAPGYLPPSTQNGAQAVNSDGNPLNTVVKGITVNGASRGSTGRLANIYVANGRVTDCVAETIACVGPGCAVSGNRAKARQASTTRLDARDH